MKPLILSSLVILSLAANAEVTISISPQSPAVTLSDLGQNPGTDRELRATAPWYQVELTLHNGSNGPAEINSILVTTKAEDGAIRVKWIPWGAITLEKGETRTIGKYLIDELPANGNLNYTATVSLQMKADGKVESRAMNFTTH